MSLKTVQIVEIQLDDSSVKKVELTEPLLKLLINSPIAGRSDYSDLPGAQARSQQTWRSYADYPRRAPSRGLSVEQRLQRNNDLRRRKLERLELLRQRREKHKILQRERRRQKELFAHQLWQGKESGESNVDKDGSTSGIIISSPLPKKHGLQKCSPSMHWTPKPDVSQRENGSSHHSKVNPPEADLEVSTTTAVDSTNASVCRRLDFNDTIMAGSSSSAQRDCSETSTTAESGKSPADSTTDEVPISTSSSAVLEKVHADSSTEKRRCVIYGRRRIRWLDDLSDSNDDSDEYIPVKHSRTSGRAIKPVERKLEKAVVDASMRKVRRIWKRKKVTVEPKGKRDLESSLVPEASENSSGLHQTHPDVKSNNALDLRKDPVSSSVAETEDCAPLTVVTEMDKGGKAVVTEMVGSPPQISVGIPAQISNTANDHRGKKLPKSSLKHGKLLKTSNGSSSKSKNIHRQATHPPNTPGSRIKTKKSPKSAKKSGPETLSKALSSKGDSTIQEGRLCPQNSQQQSESGLAAGNMPFSYLTKNSCLPQPHSSYQEFQTGDFSCGNGDLVSTDLSKALSSKGDSTIQEGRLCPQNSQQQSESGLAAGKMPFSYLTKNSCLPQPHSSYQEFQTGDFSCGNGDLVSYSSSETSSAIQAFQQKLQSILSKASFHQPTNCPSPNFLLAPVPSASESLSQITTARMMQQISNSNQLPNPSIINPAFSVQYSQPHTTFSSTHMSNNSMVATHVSNKPQVCSSTQALSASLSLNNTTQTSFQQVSQVNVNCTTVSQLSYVPCTVVLTLPVQSEAKQQEELSASLSVGRSSCSSQLYQQKNQRPGLQQYQYPQPASQIQQPHAQSQRFNNLTSVPTFSNTTQNPSVPLADTHNTGASIGDQYSSLQSMVDGHTPVYSLSQPTQLSHNVVQISTSVTGQQVPSQQDTTSKHLVSAMVPQQQHLQQRLVSQTQQQQYLQSQLQSQIQTRMLPSLTPLEQPARLQGQWDQSYQPARMQGSHSQSKQPFRQQGPQNKQQQLLRMQSAHNEFQQPPRMQDSHAVLQQVPALQSPHNQSKDPFTIPRNLVQQPGRIRNPQSQLQQPARMQVPQNQSQQLVRMQGSQIQLQHSVSMQGPRNQSQPHIRMQGPQSQSQQLVRMEGSQIQLQHSVSMQGPRNQSQPHIRMQGPQSQSQQLVRMEGSQIQLQHSVSMHGPQNQSQPHVSMQGPQSQSQQVVRMQGSQVQLQHSVSMQGPQNLSQPHVRMQGPQNQSQQVVRMQGPQIVSHQPIRMQGSQFTSQHSVNMRGPQNQAPQALRMQGPARQFMQPAGKQASDRQQHQDKSQHKPPAKRRQHYEQPQLLENSKQRRLAVTENQRTMLPPAQQSLQTVCAELRRDENQQPVAQGHQSTVTSQGVCKETSRVAGSNIHHQRLPACENPASSMHQSGQAQLTGAPNKQTKDPRQKVPGSQMNNSAVDLGIRQVPPSSLACSTSTTLNVSSTNVGSQDVLACHRPRTVQSINHRFSTPMQFSGPLTANSSSSHQRLSVFNSIQPQSSLSGPRMVRGTARPSLASAQFQPGARIFSGMCLPVRAGQRPQASSTVCAPSQNFLSSASSTTSYSRFSTAPATTYLSSNQQRPRQVSVHPQDIKPAKTSLLHALDLEQMSALTPGSASGTGRLAVSEQQPLVPAAAASLSQQALRMSTATADFFTRSASGASNGLPLHRRAALDYPLTNAQIKQELASVSAHPHSPERQMQDSSLPVRTTAQYVQQHQHQQGTASMVCSNTCGPKKSLEGYLAQSGSSKSVTVSASLPRDSPLLPHISVKKELHESTSCTLIQPVPTGSSFSWTSVTTPNQGVTALSSKNANSTTTVAFVQSCASAKQENRSSICRNILSTGLTTELMSVCRIDTGSLFGSTSRLESNAPVISSSALSLTCQPAPLASDTPLTRVNKEQPASTISDQRPVKAFNVSVTTISTALAVPGSSPTGSASLQTGNTYTPRSQNQEVHMSIDRSKVQHQVRVKQELHMATNKMLCSNEKVQQTVSVASTTATMRTVVTTTSVHSNLSSQLSVQKAVSANAFNFPHVNIKQEKRSALADRASSSSGVTVSVVSAARTPISSAVVSPSAQKSCGQEQSHEVVTSVERFKVPHHARIEQAHNSATNSTPTSNEGGLQTNSAVSTPATIIRTLVSNRKMCAAIQGPEQASLPHQVRVKQEKHLATADLSTSSGPASAISTATRSVCGKSMPTPLHTSISHQESQQWTAPGDSSKLPHHVRVKQEQHWAATAEKTAMCTKSAASPSAMPVATSTTSVSTSLSPSDGRSMGLPLDAIMPDKSEVLHPARIKQEHYLRTRESELSAPPATGMCSTDAVSNSFLLGTLSLSVDKTIVQASAPQGSSNANQSSLCSSIVAIKQEHLKAARDKQGPRVVQENVTALTNFSKSVSPKLVKSSSYFTQTKTSCQTSSIMQTCPQSASNQVKVKQEFIRSTQAKPQAAISYTQPTNGNMPAASIPPTVSVFTSHQTSVNNSSSPSPQTVSGALPTHIRIKKEKFFPKGVSSNVDMPGKPFTPVAALPMSSHSIVVTTAAAAGISQPTNVGSFNISGVPQTTCATDGVRVEQQKNLPCTSELRQLKTPCQSQTDVQTSKEHKKRNDLTLSTHLRGRPRIASLKANTKSLPSASQALSLQAPQPIAKSSLPSQVSEPENLTWNCGKAHVERAADLTTSPGRFHARSDLPLHIRIKIEHIMNDDEGQGDGDSTHDETAQNLNTSSIDPNVVSEKVKIFHISPVLSDPLPDTSVASHTAPHKHISSVIHTAPDKGILSLTSAAIDSHNPCVSNTASQKHTPVPGSASHELPITSLRANQHPFMQPLTVSELASSMSYNTSQQGIHYNLPLRKENAKNQINNTKDRDVMALAAEAAVSAVSCAENTARKASNISGRDSVKTHVVASSRQLPGESNLRKEKLNIGTVQRKESLNFMEGVCITDQSQTCVDSPEGEQSFNAYADGSTSGPIMENEMDDTRPCVAPESEIFADVPSVVSTVTSTKCASPESVSHIHHPLKTDASTASEGLIRHLTTTSTDSTFTVSAGFTSVVPVNTSLQKTVASTSPSVVCKTTINPVSRQVQVGPKVQMAQAQNAGSVNDAPTTANTHVMASVTTSHSFVSEGSETEPAVQVCPAQGTIVTALVKSDADSTVKPTTTSTSSADLGPGTATGSQCQVKVSDIASLPPALIRSEHPNPRLTPTVHASQQHHVPCTGYCVVVAPPTVFSVAGSQKKDVILAAATATTATVTACAQNTHDIQPVVSTAANPQQTAAATTSLDGFSSSNCVKAENSTFADSQGIPSLPNCSDAHVANLPLVKAEGDSSSTCATATVPGTQSTSTETVTAAQYQVVVASAGTFTSVTNSSHNSLVKTDIDSLTPVTTITCVDNVVMDNSTTASLAPVSMMPVEGEESTGTPRYQVVVASADSVKTSSLTGTDPVCSIKADTDTSTSTSEAPASGMPVTKQEPTATTSYQVVVASADSVKTSSLTGADPVCSIKADTDTSTSTSVAPASGMPVTKQEPTATTSYQVVVASADSVKTSSLTGADPVCSIKADTDTSTTTSVAPASCRPVTKQEPTVTTSYQVVVASAAIASSVEGADHVCPIKNEVGVSTSTSATPASKTSVASEKSAEFPSYQVVIASDAGADPVCSVKTETDTLKTTTPFATVIEKPSNSVDSLGTPVYQKVIASTTNAGAVTSSIKSEIDIPATASFSALSIGTSTNSISTSDPVYQVIALATSPSTTRASPLKIAISATGAAAASTVTLVANDGVTSVASDTQPAATLIKTGAGITNNVTATASVQPILNAPTSQSYPSFKIEGAGIPSVSALDTRQIQKDFSAQLNDAVTPVTSVESNTAGMTLAKNEVLENSNTMLEQSVSGVGSSQSLGEADAVSRNSASGKNVTNTAALGVSQEEKRLVVATSSALSSTSAVSIAKEHLLQACVIDAPIFTRPPRVPAVPSGTNQKSSTGVFTVLSTQTPPRTSCESSATESSVTVLSSNTSIVCPATSILDTQKPSSLKSDYSDQMKSASVHQETLLPVQVSLPAQQPEKDILLSGQTGSLVQSSREPHFYIPSSSAVAKSDCAEASAASQVLAPFVSNYMVTVSLPGEDAESPDGGCDQAAAVLPEVKKEVVVEVNLRRELIDLCQEADSPVLNHGAGSDEGVWQDHQISDGADVNNALGVTCTNLASAVVDHGTPGDASKERGSQPVGVELLPLSVTPATESIVKEEKVVLSLSANLRKEVIDLCEDELAESNTGNGQAHPETMSKAVDCDALVCGDVHQSTIVIDQPEEDSGRQPATAQAAQETEKRPCPVAASDSEIIDISDDEQDSSSVKGARQTGAVECIALDVDLKVEGDPKSAVGPEAEEGQSQQQSGSSARGSVNEPCVQAGPVSEHPAPAEGVPKQEANTVVYPHIDAVIDLCDDEDNDGNDKDKSKQEDHKSGGDEGNGNIIDLDSPTTTITTTDMKPETGDADGLSVAALTAAVVNVEDDDDDLITVEELCTGPTIIAVPVHQGDAGSNNSNWDRPATTTTTTATAVVVTGAEAATAASAPAPQGTPQQNTSRGDGCEDDVETVSVASSDLSWSSFTIGSAKTSRVERRTSSVASSESSTTAAAAPEQAGPSSAASLFSTMFSPGQSSQGKRRKRSRPAASTSSATKGSLSSLPTDSPVRRALSDVASWDKARVSAWLGEHKLDKICPNLMNLDSHGLQRMVFEHWRDPDVFFQRIIKALGVSVFQAMVICKSMRELTGAVRGEDGERESE